MRRFLPPTSRAVRVVSYQPCRYVHPYSTLGQGHDRPNNSFPYPSHISNPTPHQIFHLPLGASQKEIKSRYFDLVRLYHPDSSHIRTHSPALSADGAHARFRAIKSAYDFLSGRTASLRPDSRPHSRPSHFDPYLHELARRRRAHYNASFGYGHARGEDGSARLDRDAGEDGWGPRRGWADGFGAPKDQRGVWDQNGWKERLVLSFGVMALLAGLFPSLPYNLGSMLSPNFAFARSSTMADFEFPSQSILPDIYKNHREAVSALSQVRQETRQVGTERREGVRRRVREMAEHTADSEFKGDRDHDEAAQAPNRRR